MRKIGIGIIGWGFMGRTHAHALREMPLFYPDAGFVPELRAVCSRRIEKAREAAALLNAGFFTDDYRALLAREDIQVVSICTPNDQHEAMAVAAARAGKHIYIDKPLSTDAASAARILDAAREAGVRVFVAFNNRFWPSVMRARELIEEGRVGRVLSFGCRYLHSGSIDPDKPAGWKMLSGAGVLADLGSHALDLITWLVGYPDQVLCNLRTLYARRPLPGGGCTDELGDDQALILLKLPGGAAGFVEASKIATGAEDELSFEVRGEKGALSWQLMDADYLNFYDNTRPERPLGGERGYTRIACVGRYAPPAGSFLPPKNRVGWDRAHMHCYYSFLQSLCSDAPLESGMREALALAHLMDACARSGREAGWVRFDAGAPLS